MVGSDIKWKCVGKDTFEVVLTDYRDCNGIPFVNTPISVQSKCGGAAFSVSGTSSGGLDITPTCKKSCTRCTDRACKFPYGIQQYYITCKVILPPGCCDYKISWNQCCRSAGITTGATWNDYYIEAALNACTTPCDNSPYFTNPPVAVYCKGQCIQYNQGANDDDKNGRGEADSLVYSFTPPLQSAGNQVNWASGYSYQDPLAYDGFANQDRNGEWNPPKTCKGFHMDPATGDIQFKATKEEVTVLAIQVDEWRKDSTGKPVKIGTIRRDLQVIIMDCPDNRPPTVSGINGTNLTQMNMCADRTTCFTIKTYDPDQDDSVLLSWNKQIAGATFDAPDNKVVKWPGGKFCWQPKKSDIRTYPYYFVVTAIDNACPVPGRTAKTFTIYVLPPPEANYSAILDSCGWVKFSAVRSGKDAGTYSYTWSGDGAKRANGSTDRMYGIGSTYKYKYTAGGTYHYSLTLKNLTTGCATVYTDSVVIKNFIGVDLPKDTVLCKGSSLSITASGHGGKGTRKYYWSTGPQDPSINTITAKITKDTSFVVTIVDATLCSNYDSMKVFAHNLPKPNLGKDQRACKGDTVMLSANLKDMKTIAWSQMASSGATFLGFGQKWPVVDSGNYVVNVSDSIGCGGTDTVLIKFNPLVKVYKQSIDACRFDPITMDAGTGGPTTTWTWYDLTRSTTKPVANTKTYTLNPVLGDKFYQVVASQTLNGITCKSVDTISLYSHIKPTLPSVKLPAQCYGNSPLDLSPYVQAPAGGKVVWNYPPNKLAVLNNMLYIEQIPVKSDTLSFTIYDRYNCKVTGIVAIEVDSLPKVYAGKDTILCSAGDTMYLQGLPKGGTWVPTTGIHFTSKGVAYFAPADALTPDPIQLVYKYQSPKAAKCSSSDTMLVRVLPTPSTRAGSYGPYCKDTSTKIKPYLTAGLPQNGLWTSDPKQSLPNGALGFDNAANAFYFDPVKADSGLWRLIYTVTADGKHCAVSDTTAVKVLPQPRFTLTTEKAPKVNYCATDDAVKIITNPGGNVALTIDNNKTGGKGLIGSYFDPQSAGPGLHKIHAAYTSPSGCKNAADIFLRVDPQASADILGPNGFCEAPAYNLQGDSLNATWVKWTTPDGQIVASSSINTGFIPDTAALIKKGGRFTANLSAGNNGACKDTNVSKSFIVYNNPVVAFDANNLSGCAPLSVTITSTSTVKRSAIAYYVWTFGDGTKDSTESDVVNHVYKNPGQYSVSLKAVALKGGCYKTLVKNKYISVNPVPIVDFMATPSYTTIALPKIQFNSYDDKDVPYSQNVDDVTKYVWNFGDPKVPGGSSSTDHNPIHIYADTGRYTVSLTATNKFGCVGENTKLNYIDIRPEIIVFIPNVFKPNGHSKMKVNEKFTVVISSNATFEMNVYNRWGEQMYHSLDKNDGWDGNYRNSPAEEGVYVYVVKAQGLDGKAYTYTGTITLLR